MNDLATLLSSNEIRHALGHFWQRAVASEVDQTEERDWNARQYEARLWLNFARPLLDDQLIEKLPRPAKITSDDIWEAYERHVLLGLGSGTTIANIRTEDNEYVAAYERFIDDCESRCLLCRRSHPLFAGRIDWTFAHALVNHQFHELWRRGDEECLHIVGALPARGAGIPISPDESEVFVTLQLKGTELALDRVSGDLAAVVATILKTYELLYWPCHPVSAPRFDFDQNFLQQMALLNVALPLSGILSDDIRPEDTDPLTGDDCYSMANDMLEAYLSDPSKKDSIARRIRNALHLLVQADQQAHHAVGLALCVASIESLLCRNAGELSTLFSQNVATLLEPDPQWRPKAEGFARKLYSKRSGVLHGSETELSSLEKQGARLLAAAVLSGFVERRMARRREGHEKDETPDALLEELQRDKYTPGQTMYVPQSRVVDLWRDLPRI